MRIAEINSRRREKGDQHNKILLYTFKGHNAEDFYRTNLRSLPCLVVLIESLRIVEIKFFSIFCENMRPQATTAISDF